MKLSIIILNFKSNDFTKKCIKSIEKYPPKCKYEIIVVDNASGKEFSEEISKFCENKKIKFIESKDNLGYGQGNESGVKQAKGEYISIINPDIEVFEKTLEGLVKFLDKNKNCGIVGPRLIYPDGKTQDSFRRFPNPVDLVVKRIPFLRKIFHKRMTKFLMWDVDFIKPIEVDWIVGAFFIARKKAWDEVGGFDKRYFLFFEDTDICRKMWTKGWKVFFNPLVSARHHHERLSETNGLMDFFRKRTFRIHVSSAVKYFLKWMLKRNPRRKNT